VFDPRARSGRPLAVVGLRGASGHAPENTLASFALAVQMGADMVECDVHLSADGVPVVIHDDTLERTTSGKGLVTRHTLAELKALDAGRGETIPTLDELLAWCRDRVPLSIEIKNGPIYHQGLPERVVELLRKHEMVDRSTVISFDHVALKRVSELEPRLALGVLFAARPVDPPSLARAAGADALLPHWAFATPDLVASAHAAGLAVSVWTVNDETVLGSAVAAGVDAIATDYPDRMRAALAAAPR
jgi:glycerophosphoryl diester phosphodiesterase